MPNALVTGATGFIGRRLVDELRQRGEQVVCLARRTSNTVDLVQLGATTIEAPLDDQGALSHALVESFGGAGPDVVYHLAAKTHAHSLQDFCDVNEMGTERLCRAASRCGAPPTLVLVSSLSAAGPSPAGVPRIESAVSEPISDYGRSKLAGERAARRWADQIPLSIVRPPVVFGPGDREGLKLFRMIRRTGFHFVPQPEGLPLSVVYVDDLVDALIRIAERGERVGAAATDEGTGLYYAADPQATSYAEIGRLVARALGRSVVVRQGHALPLRLPAFVSSWIGRLRGKAPLFGLDKLREASATGWVCDPEKLTSTLDWQVATSIAERYEQTCAWYRKAGWL